MTSVTGLGWTRRSPRRRRVHPPPGIPWALIGSPTLPGTVAFFGEHGFPGWTAYPVFVAELVGGLALLAGTYTRLVALALLPVLLGIHGALVLRLVLRGTERRLGIHSGALAAVVVQAGLGDGRLALTTVGKREHDDGGSVGSRNGGRCAVRWGHGLDVRPDRQRFRAPVCPLAEKRRTAFTKVVPSAVAVITGTASVVILSQALRTLPVGTGYAAWTGIGAVGSVVLGIASFNESRDLSRLVSIALIVAGPIGLRLTTAAE